MKINEGRVRRCLCYLCQPATLQKERKDDTPTQAQPSTDLSSAVAMESDEELDFGEDEFIVPQEAVEPAPAPTLTPKATLDPLPAAAPTLKPTTASSDPSTQPASSRENGAASSSTIPTQPARPRSTDADRFAPSARTQDRYAIENRSRDRRDNGADSTRSPRPAPSRSRANSRANSPNRRPSPASRSAQPSRQPCPQPAPRTRSPTPPPQPKPPHNPRLDVSGRELPQDWESRISASQGDMYYKNVMTGESSWTIPEQAAQTKEMPEPTKEQPQQQEQEQEQPLPPSPVKKITVHPDRARLVTPLEPRTSPPSFPRVNSSLSLQSRPLPQRPRPAD